METTPGDASAPRAPADPLASTPRSPARETWQKVKGRFLALWNSERPGASLLKDLLVASLAVGVLLGGVWIYTGQPSGTAPFVVVESNSMGHADPPYGRLRTIDPGDLVFVRRVEDRGDVETFYEGGESHYGEAGDVIVYRPGGDTLRTPIIHRAMAWVTVTCSSGDESIDGCADGGDGRTFTIEELAIEDAESVTIDDLHLVNYHPLHSGFLTMGDNNPSADQPGTISPQPVRMAWVVGVARGEVPWFGLIKLAIFGNTAVPESDWCRVMAATAPCDAWVMLAVSLGVLVAVPLAMDAVKAVRERRALK